MAMRVTTHSGRTRPNGQGYNPDHNDRSRFDDLEDEDAVLPEGKIETPKNIDSRKSPENVYWNWTRKADSWYSGRDLILSGLYGIPGEGADPFSELEHQFYEEHFRAAYEAQCEKSRARRQQSRIKPFEVWMAAPQHVPEETILQIGRTGATVDNETLIACVKDYVQAEREWSERHGNPYTILDVGIHVDEAVPHAHLRKVWHSVDPDSGLDEIGQNKALERAGIALPDPTKPRSASNNRKQVYTAEMRAEWIRICRAHGVEVQDEPLKDARHGRSKAAYLNDAAKADAEAIRAAARADAAKTAADAAKAARETRDAAKENAKRTAARASTKADRILADAREDARKDADRIVTDAREEAKRIRDQALTEARAEAADIVAAAKREAADVAEATSTARRTVTTYNNWYGTARSAILELHAYGKRLDKRSQNQDAREKALNDREKRLNDWEVSLHQAGIETPVRPLKTASERLHDTTAKSDAWDAKTDEEATREGVDMMRRIIKGLPDRIDVQTLEPAVQADRQSDAPDGPTV